MKKLIIIILLSLSTIVKAQNFIGYSLYDVKHDMDTKGYAISEGITEDGLYMKYVLGHRQDMTFCYYFKNNLCFYYWYLVNGATMDMIESFLAEQRFFKTYDDKSSKEFYVNTKHKIYVKWNEELENYMIFVLTR